MRGSVKAVLQLLVMVSTGIMAAVVGMSGLDEAGDYLLLGGTLLVGLSGILVLLKMTYGPDKVPDSKLSIEVGPAAFGVAEIPVPIEPKYQGTVQKFDVGAAMEYPEGRGSTVRCRDGARVGAFAGLLVSGVILLVRNRWVDH